MDVAYLIKFKEENNVLSINDLCKKLNLSRNKIENLIKLHNIPCINHKRVKFFTFETYEYLKSLDSELHSKLLTTELKDLITLPKLCSKVNTKYGYIKTLIDSNKLDLKPKKYKSVDIYDEESEKILKEYLKEHPYVVKREVLTRNRLSKYLKVSRNKLNNYLQYFKPNSEEFDGKYYTYEFADKMKEFMDEHPSIRQNKLYVKELNDMEFDSRAEAYYYCYMKDHNHKIKYHPLNLYFIDSKGNERRYEVDFLVDGELVEIKGDNQFDENGKPFFRGKSWKEKYDCMIKNNVKIITSNKFEKNNEFNFMKKYFKEKYSFVKSVKELFIKMSEEDKRYIQSIKLNLTRNSYIYKCIETSEIHFAFEWEKILGYGVSTKICSLGRHFTHANNSERNSYILSKIEELRLKGLDISWFDKNKEKYLKTEKEEETIFNL